jgi:HK97 family phage portal protein
MKNYINQTVKVLDPFNWSRKSDGGIVEVSSTNVMNSLKRQSFVDYLLGKRRFDLAAYVAVQYFCIIAPIDNSISRIFTDVGSIQLLIFDEQEGKFIEKHSLQALLKQPNFDDTQQQFMEAFTAYYAITGDGYIIANSIDQDSEPRQLFVIPTQSVQINQGADNAILSYTVTQGSTPVQYLAVQTLNGTRYIATLPNGVKSEIYHALSYNPLASNYNIKGRSSLTSIYYEMEQFIAANIHNLSRLKRGSTLDGIFMLDEKLTDDQYTSLQEHINEYWGSEYNAGRPFLAEGGLKFQATGAEGKDMDYSKMKRELLDTFYNHFKIPLPFISPETMTLANMEAATLRFYDEAVLPTLNRLLADLTKFLMRRYKNSENFKIWYDIDSISALEPRRNEQLKAKKEIGIYTTNELRAMDRAAPIDGGQNIYGSITDVPIMVDTEDEFAAGDELERDQQQQEQAQESGKLQSLIALYKANGLPQDSIDKMVKEFKSLKNNDDPIKVPCRTLLSLYKDDKGNPLFNEEEIEKEVANL